MYFDMTQHSAVLGTHFELLEMCEPHALREAVTAEEVDAKVADFREAFEVSPECEEREIDRAAKTSVALVRLVEAHDLGHDGPAHFAIAEGRVVGAASGLPRKTLKGTLHSDDGAGRTGPPLRHRRRACVRHLDEAGRFAGD